jgi:pSer/pThr/pTyr-binding forkhead associated (FHA) protein
MVHVRIGKAGKHEMAKLVLMVDDVATQAFRVEEGTIRIGRTPDNDIFIDDASVSSQHAEIVVQQDPALGAFRDYLLKDLGSTNGTKVNGERIKQHHLSHDDTIKIGWKTFKFLDENQPSHERTAYILPEE